MSENSVANLNKRLQELNKRIDKHLLTTVAPKIKIKTKNRSHTHTVPIIFSGIICAAYVALALTNKLPFTATMGDTAVWIWAAIALIAIGASIVLTER